MSIYKQVMGEDFNRLHPMLQQRYDLPEGTVFSASGIMKEIHGGPKWLYPLFRIGIYWKLLFPEHGKNIPFTIQNRAFVGNRGESQVHWERIFHFGQKRRYFNALMSLNAERQIIQDYLGEPHLVYSDLAFHVDADGFLTIESLEQRLVLGKLEIPLPRLFQGLATVQEKYDDVRRLYQIYVTVRNPLIGTVFAYEGTFAADAES
ncbi:DUF4166 domain-containing protein [Sporosarcina sp. ACRSM]|uniref:DUF4166 domain-containing protein n=1 Tax=Sporosarcina sp. ACRSM TaxID=2918216 RepID=UPI001EF59D98|nr:DUF4166 domain-containing protein [Sporosarcina sp. ACRSM]MCG7335911.1 DUF4166 domain-containing protein [Sporosarcina sp. ACRSM]